jgi:ribosome biogenesis GTP-binding protein YsxC/EngB
MYVIGGKLDDEASKTGALASGIPGVLRAYDLALKKHGRLTLAELLLPAADLAEKGFPIDEVFARKLAATADKLRLFPASAAIFLKPDGSPLKKGDLLVQKDLAKTSAFPGRTQQINLFLINHSVYLVDLPGYGYAKIAGTKREQIEGMLNWYFFESPCIQRIVVLIIDADVGLTSIDKEMLFALEQHDKPVVILANKIDKIKKTDYDKQLATIQAKVGSHRVIPFSALEKIGVGELSDVVLGA